MGVNDATTRRAQGEPGDSFYIVETGVLAVVKDGKPVMRLTPGQARRTARTLSK